MNLDQLVSALLDKKIGFGAGTIRAFDQQLVRPDDQVYELRRAEAVASDLLKLTFAVNPTKGFEPALSELVVQRPGQLAQTDTSIEIASASYIRFEEATLTLRKGQVQTASLGEPAQSFPVPAGPALRITKHPFA